MKIIQVGSGNWGRSWMEYIKNDPECELVALVSRPGKNLELAKEKLGIPDEICYSDYDEALKLDCDLVVIALPHKLHLEYARKAVEAGKNVVIEKPLCEDLEEAKQFRDYVATKPGQHVFVSQNFRFRKQFWQIKSSFGEDGIGRPQWADVVFRQGLSHRPENSENNWKTDSWRGEQVSILFLESAIHFFDMMRFLCDSNVKDVYAIAWEPYWGKIGDYQSSMVILQFENGFKVNFDVSLCSIGFETGWQCNWMIQTDLGAAEWKYDGPVDLVMSYETEGRDLKEEFYFPGQDRAGVLNELKKGIKGEPCAVPTVEDNLNSLAISFAAMKSIEEQRVVSMSEVL
ncbi:MAG: Gfo/Idh/MocA family oxidoreductase [Lachnospiraceae bacterium]|nr:Gfo/Idh/MocA family oxidoreductase [Lachnospiraceae bacterium]